MPTTNDDPPSVTGDQIPVDEPEPPAQTRAPVTQRSRLARTAREVPTAVWWVTALHITLLLAYSILLPTFRAPDEPLHVSLSQQFSEELSYPAWDEGQTDFGVLMSMRQVNFGDRSRNLLEDEAPLKSHRASIEDLREDESPRGINQLTQHPPLYYAATGTAMKALDTALGGPVGGFDTQTWVYRLMSVLFVAPLPLIIWRCGRLLSLPGPVALAATLVPLSSPQLHHIGSAVNNDSLLWLLTWLLTPVVLCLAAGDLRLRTALLAGSLSGLALFTKAFALVLPIWVAVALGVALYRGGRERLRPTVLAAAAYAGTALALGGWWWLRNLLVYNELAPSRFSELVPTRDGVTLDPVAFVQRWGDRTTRRFWGVFGWHDVGISGWAVLIATVICVAAIAVACIRRDRIASTLPGTRLLLLAPVVLLIAVQFLLALRSHLRTGLWAGLQGRYWAGAWVAIALLVILGVAHLARRHLHLLPLGVFTAGAVMHALAVSAILGYYWGEPGSAIADRLRSLVAWAPVPGEVVAVGAVMGAVIVVVTAGQIVMLAARPSAVSLGRAPQPDAP